MEAFVILLILLTAGGGILLYSQSSGDKNIIRQIMSDIGIQGGWSREAGSQFYKWGWHEDLENRVSAERMVKQAFHKAGIWMDRQDLAFFEGQCKRYVTTGDVEEEVIKERISGIVTRSERVRNWAAEQIRAVIDFVQMSTPQEAQSVLKEIGRDVEVEEAPAQLCLLELKRMLYKQGMNLAAINAKGLLVQDPVSGQEFHLEGMDSWRHLLRIFREGIMDCLAGKHHQTLPSSLSRVLKSAAESGLLVELDRDIDQARVFRKKLYDQIQNKEITVSMERIKTVDTIFYKWQFDENVRFELADHIRWRDLLTRMDLAPRFREIILERIDESYSSLFRIARIFPRYVLFYGGKGAARSFATDQYARHYLALVEALGGIMDAEFSSPTIIWIAEDKVEKMRHAPKRGTNAVTLRHLISDQQRISRMEQNISEEVADRKGWIINLALDDPSTDEYQELNKDPLKSYMRFLCDAADEVDFLNNTYNAKKSRVQFFNMVIDSLVDVPSITDHEVAVLSNPEPVPDDLE